MKFLKATLFKSLLCSTTPLMLVGSACAALQRGKLEQAHLLFCFAGGAFLFVLAVCAVVTRVMGR